ncbi:hypothetical protein [Nonomuraea sp. CA-141351]|uniref:hypothetical protein n=1 Tax=Nonomuraea sp. CA-141351 TaxID=3239996 RepID=UPI003D91851B
MITSTGVTVSAPADGEERATTAGASKRLVASTCLTKARFMVLQTENIATITLSGVREAKGCEA